MPAGAKLSNSGTAVAGLSSPGLSSPGPSSLGPSSLGSTLKVPLNLKAAQAAIHGRPALAEQDKRKQTTAAAEIPPALLGNSAFTHAQLQQHWQAFFVQLKQNNGSPIELMLAGAALELHNGSDVYVLLSSSLQEEPFERLKPKLQHYLRQQLQNSQLNLQPQLSEESGPRRLYTNNEKFQHLLQRYPLLGELKERLGLETDF